jgi:hypothetical protein
LLIHLVADDRTRRSADDRPDNRASRRGTRLVADHGTDGASNPCADECALFFLVQRGASRKHDRGREERNALRARMQANGDADVAAWL